jgi:hypothetical protein
VNVTQGISWAKFDVMLKSSKAVNPSSVVNGKPGVPPPSHTGRLNLRAPPGPATSMRGP